MKDIIKATNHSNIDPISIFESKIFCAFSNNFEIMEDSNTIIGIKYDEEQNQNMLVKETLGIEKNQHYFFETSSNILTLLLKFHSNKLGKNIKPMQKKSI